MFPRWYEWRGHINTKLQGLETILAEQRADSQRDHDCLEAHARATQTAVQELQNASIRRGEQLDALLRLHKGLSMVGTALLLSFLGWFGVQLWQGIVRQNTLPLPRQSSPHQQEKEAR